MRKILLFITILLTSFNLFSQSTTYRESTRYETEDRFEKWEKILLQANACHSFLFKVEVFYKEIKVKSGTLRTYKYKYVITNKSNYAIDFHWKWNFGNNSGGSLGIFRPGTIRTDVTLETTENNPTLTLYNLKFEFNKAQQRKYSVPSLSRTLKCNDRGVDIIKEYREKKNTKQIAHLKKKINSLSKSTTNLKEKIKLYKQLERLDSDSFNSVSYRNKIREIEKELSKLKKSKKKDSFWDDDVKNEEKKSDNFWTEKKSSKKNNKTNFWESDRLKVEVQKPINNSTSSNNVVDFEAKYNVFSDAFKGYLEYNGINQRVTPVNGKFRGKLVLKSGINYVTFKIKSSHNIIFTKKFKVNYSGKPVKLRATLTWDGYADIDLYLKDAKGNTCSYSNKNTSLATLDVDNRRAYGPENISVEKIISGEYEVYIKNFSKKSGIRATVYIFLDEKLYTTKSHTFNGYSNTKSISTLKL